MDNSSFLKNAPAITCADWTSLLEDFCENHPTFRALPARELRQYLTPAASVAWWLCSYRPDLLDKEKLHLLIPGAGFRECTDHGKWFQFIPWLVDKPALSVSVSLVGDQLYLDSNGHPCSSNVLTNKEKRQQRTTAAEHLLTFKTSAKIIEGTIGDWYTLSDMLPDLCILFSPGFSTHYETWLIETELLPLLREKVPTALFCYSELDWAEDSYVLSACGLHRDNTESKLNPWRRVPALDFESGGFANCAGTLMVPIIPLFLHFDTKKLEVLKETSEHLMGEYVEGRGDGLLLTVGTRISYERDGSTFSPPRVGTFEEHAFILPYFLLVMESDGAVLYRNKLYKGFRDVYQMSLPISVLEGWPFKDPIERLIAAVQLHRDVIAPKMSKLIPIFGARTQEALDLSLSQFRDEVLLQLFSSNKDGK